jgi:hypothetical protein
MRLDFGFAGGDVHSINETLKIKKYDGLGYIRISKKLMKQTTVHTWKIFVFGKVHEICELFN